MKASGRWSAGLLVLALVAAVTAGVMAGPVPIPFANAAAILSHAAAGWPEVSWPAWQETILLWVRLPRALVGALVGGALALSGAVMQAIFRNPMADPGVLGVTSGAALGAVLALYTGLAEAALLALPGCAFAGALACALVVYAIATSRGRTAVATLLLAGIAVGSFAISLTSFILSLALANYEVGRQMLFWLMGGLDARSWTHVAIAAPFVLGGAALAFVHARDLNVLSTGEEGALALGVDVPRLRLRLIALTTVMTAAAVSVSGSILFVGLVVPHILRLVLGPDHRALLPASFLFGGTLLVAMDLAARTVLAPGEIQLGVITTLLGGPFFVYLLVAYRNRVTAL